MTLSEFSFSATRSLRLTLFVGLLAGVLSAQTFEGVYWAPNPADGKIRLERAGDSIIGRVVAIRPSRKDQKDIYHPDPAKRDQPVLGSRCMYGFSWDAEDQQWVDGTIYDCKTGNEYRAKLWLDDDGNLRARGYLLVSLFGKTERFERVHPSKPPSSRESRPRLVYLDDEPRATAPSPQQ